MATVITNAFISGTPQERHQSTPPTDIDFDFDIHSCIVVVVVVLLAVVARISVAALAPGDFGRAGVHACKHPLRATGMLTLVVYSSVPYHCNTGNFYLTYSLRSVKLIYIYISLSIELRRFPLLPVQHHEKGSRQQSWAGCCQYYSHKSNKWLPDVATQGVRGCCLCAEAYPTSSSR